MRYRIFAGRCRLRAPLCALVTLALVLTACGGDGSTSPSGSGASSSSSVSESSSSTSSSSSSSSSASSSTSSSSSSSSSSAPQADADTTLRKLLADNHVTAPAKPVLPDALYSLGLNLFSSTLLSGNRKVSCASCHATGNSGVDNLMLAIGINGTGTAAARTGTPVIHRNTPDLLNALVAGGRQYMFWDGRVALEDGVFTTPAGANLPAGIDSAVAAQALFPMVTRTEMLGYYDLTDSNELADLVPADAVVEADPRAVWDGIMVRLRADASLSGALQAAYPDVPLEDIGIQHVGNALAAFQARRWYNFGSTNVLVGYIAGTVQISDAARRGGLLFFGDAGCSRCHTGPLLTDQKFHNLAVPQIGPGFGSGAAQSPPRDLGRQEVTGADADRYAFLTPSLWEVKNTFPYFHDGVYPTLEAVIRHHLDPAGQVGAFRCPASLTEAGSPVACSDITTAPDLYADILAHLDPAFISPVSLTDDQIADLTAFLDVLTDGNNTSVR